MQPIYLYLAKMILCSGLFLGYYWIALRNRRFHFYNRFYLLFASLSSLFIPLLHFSWLTQTSEKNVDITLLKYLYESKSLPDVIVSNHTSWTSSQIIFYILLATSIVFLGIYLKRIFQINQLKKRYPKYENEGLTVFNTNLVDAPFSFFQSLFWRKDIEMDSTIGKQILEHEIAHIQQKHSLDKMFLQLLCSLFWFNPFYWIIQKELAMIHEFMADEKSIQDRDTQSFAQMLLTAQYGNAILNPINAFAYSPIKRRLMMLTKTQKTKFSYARRLMILPLLAGSMLLFAFRLKEENLTKIDLLEWAKSAGINITPFSNFNRNDIKTIVLPDTIIRIKDKTGKRDTMVTSPNSSTIIMAHNSNDTIRKLRLEKSNGDTSVIIVNGRPGLTKKPLIVVDGIPYNQGDINTLNPNDIESINVIKDKNAEAIYGLNARDGLILVTTKQGRVGSVKPNNDLNDLLNTPEADRSVTVVGFVKKGAVSVTNDVREAKFDGSWREYLERNLRADVPAKNGAPAGRNYTVVVSFLVSKTGVLSDVRAENNPGYGVAEEGVRAIKASSHWLPATKNGKPIVYRQRQQITFQVVNQ